MLVLLRRRCHGERGAMSFDDEYKALKIPLKHVLRNESDLVKINEVVLEAHKMVSRCTLFLKLYLLKKVEKGEALPKIDRGFVANCLRIQCEESRRGRPPKEESKLQKDSLKRFYDEHFLPVCRGRKPSAKNFTNVLQYLSEEIVTGYENNVRQNYFRYLRAFLNFSFPDLQQKNVLGALTRDVTRAKDDEKLESPAEFHEWIRSRRPKLVPTGRKFRKDSVAYDLECDPLGYLPCMIYMMAEIERAGRSIPFNVFPLRTSCVPKHVTIDTTSLVALLHTGKGKSKRKADLSKEGTKQSIWNEFFFVNKRCFRKAGYDFHFMIRTDGISCSLVFSRRSRGKNSSTETYMEQDDVLRDKKLVGIDPGLNDLVFCIDESGNKLRYSQDRRRKETKSKKFSKLISSKKEEAAPFPNDAGKPQTVNEIETELSKFDRKTLSFSTFKRYCEAKLAANHRLFSFYKDSLFRKLKLNLHLNRKRSEQRFVSEFKKKFGQDCVICFGDYERRRGFKGKEPTKGGRSFKDLFRKSGYEVLLVDEHKTSCMCFKCKGGRCEKFVKRRDPRPFKRGEERLVHGLLRCTTCGCVWNRDVNGASNILFAAKSVLSGEGRPRYLSRSSSGAFYDAPNQNDPSCYADV